MDKETPVRDSQTKALELEERLIDFAVRIVRLTSNSRFEELRSFVR